MIEFLVQYGPIIGYIIIFGIIFAESGLLIGFFLPGDSLLFTAGFLASPASRELLRNLGLPAENPFFMLGVLMVGCFIAAVTGDSVGYLFGKSVGRRLFNKEDSLLFSKKNVLAAQAFYEKHGGKAIVLARFVPVIRTFAPIVAGIGEMHYPRFLAFNVVGGALWAMGVTLGGYFLGQLIGPENIDKYLLPIIFLIVFISVLPAVLHVVRDPENREAIRRSVTRIFNRSAVTTVTSVTPNSQSEE